jgi:hypothetical protein
VDVGLVIPLRLDAVPQILRVEHRKTIPAETIMRRLLPTAETTLLPAGGYHRAKLVPMRLTCTMRLNNQSTHPSVAISRSCMLRHGPWRWTSSVL